MKQIRNETGRAGGFRKREDKVGMRGKGKPGKGGVLVKEILQRKDNGTKNEQQTTESTKEKD